MEGDAPANQTDNDIEGGEGGEGGEEGTSEGGGESERKESVGSKAPSESQQQQEVRSFPGSLYVWLFVPECKK